MTMAKAAQKAQLLEAYGHAQADSAMLNVILQSMTDHPGSPPGVDATIVRSIERAEREMYEIKSRYEEGE